MRARIVLITVITASLVFIGSKMVFSEDAMPEQSSQPQDTQSEVIQGGAVPETKVEPETQWVWGEVVTVDSINKAISIKYLDYETDQEKDITIAIDDKTTFENAASIEELKPTDTVSIDYISVDGKNIAENISVEKPEAPVAPQVQAPETQIQPQDLTPPTQAPVEQSQPQESSSGN